MKVIKITPSSTLQVNSAIVPQRLLRAHPFQFQLLR
jgi:hypothetical protein